VLTQKAWITPGSDRRQENRQQDHQKRHGNILYIVQPCQRPGAAYSPAAAAFDALQHRP
jgi:hypothetical protein